MYHIGNAQVRCPNCHKFHTVQVYDLIHIQEQPGIKEQLLNGSLFETTCPSCQMVDALIYPCMYHDDRLMIYLATNDEEYRIFDRLKPAHTTCRVVTSWDEMIEKIAIFDAGLDDHRVECVKYQRLTQLHTS